jgi:hypothetical protein
VTYAIAVGVFTGLAMHRAARASTQASRDFAAQLGADWR